MKQLLWALASILFFVLVFAIPAFWALLFLGPTVFALYRVGKEVQRGPSR
jgi:hypothetical protein